MSKDIYSKLIEPSIKDARKRRREEIKFSIFDLNPKYINFGLGKKYHLKMKVEKDKEWESK